mmetsp:Transcript_22656/g.70231  ORF Transcript_22656/g.70231 Transcript_22656/m.70231 type:complete len:279 (-) Transcript_22656:59-895(-)
MVKANAAVSHQPHWVQDQCGGDRRFQSVDKLFQRSCRTARIILQDADQISEMSPITSTVTGPVPPCDVIWPACNGRHRQNRITAVRTSLGDVANRAAYQHVSVSRAFPSRRRGVLGVCCRSPGRQGQAHFARPGMSSEVRVGGIAASGRGLWPTPLNALQLVAVEFLRRSRGRPSSGRREHIYRVALTDRARRHVATGVTSESVLIGGSAESFVIFAASVGVWLRRSFVRVSLFGTCLTHGRGSLQGRRGRGWEERGRSSWAKLCAERKRLPVKAMPL